MSLADVIKGRILAEREARFGALKLPPDFIAPNYGGRSIVNVPSSIVKIMGGQIGTAALDPEILDGLSGGPQPLGAGTPARDTGSVPPGGS